MTEILKTIELIEDKRQEKKIRHKLLDVVVIVLFAKLANADDWQEIEILQSQIKTSSDSTLDLKMASLRMTQCRGLWVVLHRNIYRVFIKNGMNL